MSYILPPLPHVTTVYIPPPSRKGLDRSQVARKPKTPLDEYLEQFTVPSRVPKVKRRSSHG